MEYIENEDRYLYKFGRRRIVVHTIIFFFQMCSTFLFDWYSRDVNHFVIRGYTTSTIINSNCFVLTFFTYSGRISGLLTSMRKVHSVQFIDNDEKDKSSFILKYLLLQAILIFIYLIFISFEIFTQKDIFNIYHFFVIFPCLLLKFQGDFLRVLCGSKCAENSENLKKLGDAIHDKDDLEDFEKIYNANVACTREFYDVFNWTLLTTVSHTFYHLIAFFFNCIMVYENGFSFETNSRRSLTITGSLLTIFFILWNSSKIQNDVSI